MKKSSKKGTETSTFGVSKREGHDSSRFYNSSMHREIGADEISASELKRIEVPPPGTWADQVYLGSSEKMSEIPDNSVALAFTSPPYNAQKGYEGHEDDLSLTDYLGLIQRVAVEVYRVLRPGGRYVVNIANLGRKPYIPMHAHFYNTHMGVGFLPLGEIIWQKARGASGSCAWGSWMSAKAPRPRDIHEYLLIFCKQSYSRPDKGESDIDKDEFMAGTLSVWEIPPESAKRVGHPAPFSIPLAERVIQMFSYVGDVVLDPFLGSGTTCVAAIRNSRHYVGYDITPEYVGLSLARIDHELEGADSDA